MRRGPDISYVYVPLVKSKVCVAPITSAVPEGKTAKAELNFWAVGRDAQCLEGGGIQGCDDGVADGSGPVKSGVIDQDLTGDFRMAAHMASIRCSNTERSLAMFSRRKPSFSSWLTMSEPRGFSPPPESEIATPSADGPAGGAVLV